MSTYLSLAYMYVACLEEIELRSSARVCASHPWRGVGEELESVSTEKAAAMKQKADSVY